MSQLKQESAMRTTRLRSSLHITTFALIGDLGSGGHGGSGANNVCDHSTSTAQHGAGFSAASG